MSQVYIYQRNYISIIESKNMLYLARMYSIISGDIFRFRLC